jgi:hypothetical protein
MIRSAAVAMIAAIVLASTAVAQASGLPSFNAPYRSFNRYEAGFAVTFPGLDDAAVEGLYRFGSGKFDIGLRGGIWFVSNAATNDEIIALGLEARERILTHSADFPADGALIFGAGLQVGAADNFIPSVGVSFGRRLDVEDSDVSIVPFIQPHMWWFIGDADDVQFSLGFGADFRLSPRFDLRLSTGIGDIDGLSLAAVWIR